MWYETPIVELQTDWLQQSPKGPHLAEPGRRTSQVQAFRVIWRAAQREIKHRI
jgi:hypothetical protein